MKLQSKLRFVQAMLTLMKWITRVLLMMKKLLLKHLNNSMIIILTKLLKKLQRKRFPAREKNSKVQKLKLKRRKISLTTCHPSESNLLTRMRCSLLSASKTKNRNALPKQLVLLVVLLLSLLKMFDFKHRTNSRRIKSA